MHSVSDLKFVSSSVLRSWFNKGSPSGNGKFAVIDVRDSDYIGGHIKGCWHYPAGDFGDNLPKLQAALVANDINDVVFHCALSQARGPKSALVFLRSLESVDQRHRQFFDSLNVWVLKGGFTRWQEKYGDDPSVTEDYDKDVWNFGAAH